MKVTITKPSETVQELVIEVPAEDVIKEIERETERVRKKTTIHGFRTGKAPIAIIKRQYGKQIEATAIDTAMQNAYRAAIDEHKLNPLDTAEISDIAYEPGNPLVFTAKIEVMPDFSLGDLSGMRVERKEPSVTPEMIEEAVKQMQLRFGTLKMKEEPAAVGDLVTLDIAEIDPATGIQLIGKNYPDRVIRLGEKFYGPEFDEQLIGTVTGEKKRISRRLEQYMIANPQQQGTQNPTEEHFLITIKKVEAVELPEINDTFAQEQKYETVAALKDGLKSKLQEELLESAKSQFNDALEREVVRIVNPPVPQVMVERYLNQLEENYKKISKKPVDSKIFREEYETHSRQEVQWFLVLNKIIETLNLSVSDQEIEEYLQDYSQKLSLDIERVRLHYRSGDKRKELSQTLLHNKVYNYLESKAEVTTVRK